MRGSKRLLAMGLLLALLAPALLACGQTIPIGTPASTGTPSAFHTSLPYPVPYLPDPLLATGGVSHLNISQSVDGVTVTLALGYADTNIVAVSLSSTGLVRPETLRTASGIALPPLTNDYAHAFKGSAVGISVATLEYDATKAPMSGPSVDLVLTLSVSAAPDGENVQNAGTFTFDFSLPVTPAHPVDKGPVNIGQTDSESGATVTLDSLDVGLTGVLVRMTLPEGFLGHGETSLVQIGAPVLGYKRDLAWWDGHSVSGAGERLSDHGASDGGQPFAYRAGVYLPHVSGLWDVRLYRVKGDAIYDSVPPIPQWIGGPWVFRFRVPPAS